ncbi:MAG: hypothetical protein AAFR79_17145 [Pseudomonadota bacterium]
MLTITAASAMQAYDPIRAKNAEPDGKSFRELVRFWFPWDQATIEDDQHHPPSDRHTAAAEALYMRIRNPSVQNSDLAVSRAGGATLRPVLQLRHGFPGLCRREELADLAVAALPAISVSAPGSAVSVARALQ